MRLEKHGNGIYYAHLVGSRPINMHTGDKDEAFRLAKEANLEAIEFAARANLLTAEAVQRLSAGGKISGLKALDMWREHPATKRRAPNTVATYDSHIRRFLHRYKLENAPISAATEGNMDSFVNGRDDVGVSTREVRLAALSHFFRFTHAKGMTMGNPATLLEVDLSGLTFEQKEPKKREAFTDEELTWLSTVEHPFWTPAIVLGENYGLRISDIINLEWASFDMPGSLIVWTDKHDKRIEMALVHSLIGMLPKREGRWVFERQHRLTKSAASISFARILRKLGIHGKSFHCLRHTFATRRSELGDSVDAIRQKLGHSFSTTTQGYIHNKQ